MNSKGKSEGDSDVFEVSEYEKIREANIREKDALLESLNIKADAGIYRNMNSNDFECGDCSYCSFLSGLRRHVFETGHNMKIDYEAIALARAKKRGPRDVELYERKSIKRKERMESEIKRKESCGRCCSI